MSDEQKARDALAGLALAMTSDPDEVRKKMTGIWYMLVSDAMEMIAESSSIDQEVKDRLVAHLDENLVLDGKDRCDVLQFGMACGNFMANAHSLEEMQAIRKLLFEFHDIPKYEYK
jgi:hypothetical protein